MESFTLQFRRMIEMSKRKPYQVQLTSVAHFQDFSRIVFLFHFIVFCFNNPCFPSDITQDSIYPFGVLARCSHSFVTDKSLSPRVFHVTRLLVIKMDALNLNGDTNALTRLCLLDCFKPSIEYSLPHSVIIY